MSNQLHYLGYVIYTFEDLQNDPQPLLQLFSLLDRQYGGQFLRVIRVSGVAPAEPEGSHFVSVDRRELYEQLEDGRVSRLQAHDRQTLKESSMLLRISINSSSDDPHSPSFVFFAFTNDREVFSSNNVAERGLETAVKVFEILNGVYGYANAGALTRDGSVQGEEQPKFALGLVDFGQLSTTPSVKDEIPGIFWANLLSNYQVESSGGLAKILSSVYCFRKQQLGNGGVLLVLCEDPFAAPGELNPSVLESMVKLLEDSSEASIERRLETSLQEAVQAEELQLEYREVGLRRLEQHVQDFDENYLQVGKVPRNYVWRPYRFCTQDVVLGLTVVRHSPDRNCLEVDVCLTSDIPEYEDGSSARVMGSFLLSEAYKCGGSMEIRFSENVEGGRVPLALTELAAQHDIQLSHSTEGRIRPSEAKQLYVEVTNFTPNLRRRLEELAKNGLVSREKACFVVQRGIWTKSELEHLIFGSMRVEAILSGEAVPEQRHIFLNDLSHARAAVMGGYLDRKIAKRDRGDKNEAVDLEDDVRPLDIGFAKELYAKEYHSREELPIPWVAGAGNDQPVLSAGGRAVILVRAYDAIGLGTHLANDLALARQATESILSRNPRSIVGILVPRDFEDLPHSTKDSVLEEATRSGVHILICPETMTVLSTDATRRLVTSRITRE